MTKLLRATQEVLNIILFPGSYIHVSGAICGSSCRNIIQLRYGKISHPDHINENAIYCNRQRNDAFRGLETKMFAVLSVYCTRSPAATHCAIHVYSCFSAKNWTRVWDHKKKKKAWMPGGMTNPAKRSRAETVDQLNRKILEVWLARGR